MNLLLERRNRLMISTSKKFLQNNKFKKLECADMFPNGSFIGSFGVKHDLYQSINLNDLYNNLLKLKVKGEFEEKEFARILREFLKSYSISCSMKDAAFRNIALHNSLRIGGEYRSESEKGLHITLYFDRKRFTKRMIITNTIWKQYSRELTKTISHELIHLCQFYKCTEEDIYDFVTFDKPEGIKKTHYDEMIYVNETAEIEAFTFEACIEAKHKKIDPLFSDDLFSLIRAAQNFDKYFLDKSYYNSLKTRIENSISFWQKYLK